MVLIVVVARLVGFQFVVYTRDVPELGSKTSELIDVIRII